MGERFYADPDELRARAPEHERIAADVAATVQALRKALAAEGAPWGDDDAGHAFAEFYLPEHRQTMADLDSLVQVLQQSGSDLRQLAQNLADTDLLGGRLIDNAGNETQNGAGSTVVGNGMSAYPTSDAATERTASQPAAGTTAPAANAVPPIHEAPTSAIRPAGTHGSDNGAPSPADGAASNPQQSDETTEKGSDRDQPNPEQPRTDGASSPGPGVQPVPQADAGRRTQPTAGSRTTPPATAAPAGTPWSKPGATAAGTPWSKPTTRPPRVSAPEAGRQDAPPRIPGRPAPARANGKGEESNRKTAQSNSAESRAARLARELAERHGVQAFGFDLPDIPDVVLTEIVAAVDDVLPRYPQLDLHAIGIDELPDGEPTRLEWDSALRTARIVLARHAATDHAQLERTDNAPPGYAQRPVYSSIVHELGAALDAAGGFRARTAAQRALLTAYLPQAREDRGSLNRTVSGFRTWRAQLSARSFHHGQLDPATALAEAFTDVVLNATRATPPAQILHSLLVRTAGSDRASTG